MKIDVEVICVIFELDDEFENWRLFILKFFCFVFLIFDFKNSVLDFKME